MRQSDRPRLTALVAFRLQQQHIHDPRDRSGRPARRTKRWSFHITRILGFKRTAGIEAHFTDKRLSERAIASWHERKEAFDECSRADQHRDPGGRRLARSKAFYEAFGWSSSARSATSLLVPDLGFVPRPVRPRILRETPRFGRSRPRTSAGSRSRSTSRARRPRTRPSRRRSPPGADPEAAVAPIGVATPATSPIRTDTLGVACDPASPSGARSDHDLLTSQRSGARSRCRARTAPGRDRIPGAARSIRHHDLLVRPESPRRDREVSEQDTPDAVAGDHRAGHSTGHAGSGRPVNSS